MFKLIPTLQNYYIPPPNKTSVNTMEGSQPAEAQPQQQPQQQPYQQPFYPQPYPAAPAQPLTPPPIPGMYMGLAIFGGILLVVGLMVGSAATFTDDYNDTKAIGEIIGEVGGLMLVLGLLIPAFAVHDLDPIVRSGLLIAAGLITGLLVLSL